MTWAYVTVNDSASVGNAAVETTGHTTTACFNYQYRLMHLCVVLLTCRVITVLVLFACVCNDVVMLLCNSVMMFVTYCNLATLRKRLQMLSWQLSAAHTRLNLRRPSFSSRCCTDLEQSCAAYHICSITSCLLLSLEDIPLRTLLSVITVVMPAKWHCH